MTILDYIAAKPRRASAAHPAAKQTPLIPVPGLSCTLWREAFAHL